MAVAVFTFKNWQCGVQVSAFHLWDLEKWGCPDGRHSGASAAKGLGFVF